MLLVFLSHCTNNRILSLISRYIFLLLILFLLPGIVMTVAYAFISLELYRGIKFEVNQKKGMYYYIPRSINEDL